MRIPQSFAVARLPWALAPPGVTHRHLEHTLSRRAFIGRTAGVAGAALGASLLTPETVLARERRNTAPRPSTNAITLTGPNGPVTFHFTFFGAGIDPTSITDFKGVVGVADVQGTGTATNPDGSTETLLFDTDMRFMSGVYFGMDGAVHKGAFGFV
jgi:hypothetical protein